MITATIFEAKTNLSKLVRQAQDGEEVIITSGKTKQPVARLQAIAPVKPKRLGANYDPDFVLSKSFWDPLPDEELDLWEGKED